MDDNNDLRSTFFYKELNQILRAQLPLVREKVEPTLIALKRAHQFIHPLTFICHFERISHDVQWRLEIDFDDYEWSETIVKPHLLGVFFSIRKELESAYLSFRVVNSFNDDQVAYEKSKDKKEIMSFIADLVDCIIKELQYLDFKQLEFLAEE